MEVSQWDKYTDDMDQLVRCIEDEGYVILPSNWTSNFIEQLRQDLFSACQKCAEIQAFNSLDVIEKERSLSGAAHHLLPFSDTFIEVLKKELYIPLIEKYLGGKVILNNAGGFINVGSGLYDHALSIHRDVRTANKDYQKQMVIVLMTLDDFTKVNGATYLLPGSHSMETKPDKDYFSKHSRQAIVPAGTFIIFDARIWHSAGINSTNLPRRAITYGFTRPFFKQQFDYCRALGLDNVQSMSDNLRQLLGFYSRVPTSHDEWYQPIENRFYRRDQG